MPEPKYSERKKQVHTRQLYRVHIVCNIDQTAARDHTVPRGSEFFPLRAVPYGMINHFYHIG